MSDITKEDSKPLIVGVDFEFDPQGRVMFTQHYLLKRGVCCGSGCKNCPYDPPHQGTNVIRTKGRTPTG